MSDSVVGGSLFLVAFGQGRRHRGGRLPIMVVRGWESGVGVRCRGCDEVAAGWLEFGLTMVLLVCWCRAARPAAPEPGC